MGRLVGITGMIGDDGVEIEEEFDTVEFLPRYKIGSSVPEGYIKLPSTETRRRIVRNPVEISAFKERL